MTYEVCSCGNGAWEVRKNGALVPGAVVKRIEFPEGHKDGPNGRTYYIAGPATATIRLPDRTLIDEVPLKL